MPPVRLLSSDLNGTLVHPHTMQEMILFAFPGEPERYERARTAFSAQTEGRLSMEETFEIAGEQSRGLPLRAAIDYAMGEMAFVDGYSDLTEFLSARRMHLAIISTGYSVTLYVIRHGTQTPFFHVWCNRLLFSEPSGRMLEEQELEALVRAYLNEPDARRSDRYDRILACGKVDLGIQNEADKARLALELARSLEVPQQQVAHMGDTMGDSGGIVGVARAGGMGIAFNYNQALEAFLLKEAKEELNAGRIVLVDAKGNEANLEHVLDLLERGAPGDR